MDKLTPRTRGLWSVETVSGSIYLLDLDNRVVSRQAETGAGDSNSLRRDGDPVKLFRLQQCEVGDNMVLFLDLNVPGIDFTTRISTSVIRIERIRVPLDRGM